MRSHKRSIDFSLLSDRKVNLVTTGGRETLEAKRDVACLLQRHISTGREYFAEIRFRSRNWISAEGKRVFSHRGYECLAREASWIISTNSICIMQKHPVIAHVHQLITRNVGLYCVTCSTRTTIYSFRQLHILPNY